MYWDALSVCVLMQLHNIWRHSILAKQQLGSRKFHSTFHIVCSNLHSCWYFSTPSSLRDLRVSVSSIPGHRSLHFAAQGNLLVPQDQTYIVQHPSFAVVTPSFRNRLLSNLQHELLGHSQPLFRKCLKIILFNCHLELSGWDLGALLRSFSEVVLNKSPIAITT